MYRNKERLLKKEKKKWLKGKFWVGKRKKNNKENTELLRNQ